MGAGNTCSRTEEELTVEMRAADRDHRGGGPAIMALVTLFEKILADDGIRRVVTSVGRDNDDAARLLDDKFYELIYIRLAFFVNVAGTQTKSNVVSD